MTVFLSGNVADVLGFLENNGGDPRNVGEDYIEAYVPVTLLGPLSEQAGVTRVREIVAPEPEYGPITSQGALEHGASAWNEAGYTGRGIRVGIIDTFEGIRDLMGTELPATIVSRCYTSIGRFSSNLADCDSDDSHGTEVAEAIMDVAPGVSLYVANPASPADLADTVRWMAGQGVTVINRSASRSVFEGPGDGTSPYSNSIFDSINYAAANGIVWVNSTGNYATETWYRNSPVIYTLRSADVVAFDAVSDDTNGMLGMGEEVRVVLRWDDRWGGASSDLDLLLWDTIRGEFVVRSEDYQTGQPGHDPLESVTHQLVEGRLYEIIVVHRSGSVPDWVQVMVRGNVGTVEHYTKSGSLNNAAESANSGMLAVGAAHWDDVRTIEPYSSRGPTPDGRVKPDVVGATCGATALEPLDEYNKGFCGTSQAAPHVAGLAALVRQRFPSYTPAQVAGYLKDNAEQRQSPDPNSTWGHGFVKLPPPDGTAPSVPAPSNAFSRNPAADFNTLAAARNNSPEGIWSDRTTMWVADHFDEKIYAYDMATRARLPAKDFNTLEAAGNTWPTGISSDGTTMWVADYLDEKIYAYDMATRARVPGKEFNTLVAAGNTWPTGIWSNGTTMWVADYLDEKIYAYDVATRTRNSSRDFDTLKAARNISPQGIWSDGTTMWVADSLTDKVYAYDMATKARVPDREFNTLEAAGNWITRGIWSDGTTMYAADLEDDNIYAYAMPKTDRDALVALYNATGGTRWTNSANWSTKRHIGQWHGVTTDSSGRVTHLDLSENQLAGGIPTELGSLTNLTTLWLWENQLTGEIPTEIGDLANLEQLYLPQNRLTGDIPVELGSLAKLEELVLWDNQLTGPVPTWLGRLSNLTVLSLSSNQLTGEIPTELGDLANLEILSLWGNALTGGIPTELGDLTNLEELYLSDNQLTGEIPVEIGNLANLGELVLWGNQLTGPVPTWLGDLTNLTVLNLWGNQLTGKIPTELGGLANLEKIYLSQNSLTGCVPTGLRRVTDNDFSQLGLPFCSAPQFAAEETGERTVEENTGPGMPIGDPVAATAPDSTTLTYELGGADAADFAIDSATGQLKTKSPLDYEAKSTYTVTVTARDGDAGHDDVTVTINVTNVDEDGDVTLSSTTTAAVGTAITASLTDPDGSVSGEAWQWQSSATTTGTYSDISGATSASYTPTNDDAGMYIRAMVSYTDGHGAGKSAMSQAVMVAAAPTSLLERYDADNDGCIQLSEARTAIGDYFGPPLGEALSLEDARKVIGLYFNCLSQSQ